MVERQINRGGFIRIQKRCLSVEVRLTCSMEMASSKQKVFHIPGALQPQATRYSRYHTLMQATNPRSIMIFSTDTPSTRHIPTSTRMPINKHMWHIDFPTPQRPACHTRIDLGSAMIRNRRAVPTPRVILAIQSHHHKTNQACPCHHLQIHNKLTNTMAKSCRIPCPMRQQIIVTVLPLHHFLFPSGAHYEPLLRTVDQSMPRQHLLKVHFRKARTYPAHSAR